MECGLAIPHLPDRAQAMKLPQPAWRLDISWERFGVIELYLPQTVLKTQRSTILNLLLTFLSL